MAIGKNVGLNGDLFTDYPLYGKTSEVDLRLYSFDYYPQPTIIAMFHMRLLKGQVLSRSCTEAANSINSDDRCLIHQYHVGMYLGIIGADALLGTCGAGVALWVQ